MWRRIEQLVLFLSLFYLLLRVVEWNSYLFMNSLPNRLVDPLALSARKLRAILDRRGIRHDASLLIEKHELTELIVASGHKLNALPGGVTIAEIDDAEQASKLGTYSGNRSDSENNIIQLMRSNDHRNEQDERVVFFTGADHFNEQVEDCKDSIWLVNVIVGYGGSSKVSPILWSNIIDRFSPFGVRFGVYNCHDDYRLCTRRDWNSSRLMIALPNPNEKKSGIQMFAYTGAYRTTAIVQFVYSRTAPNVRRLSSSHAISNFLRKADTTDLCLLLVSSLTLPPFFLSALSAKFSGRIRFGITSPTTFYQLTADESTTTSSSQGRYYIFTGHSRTEYAARDGGRIADRPYEMINFDRLGALLEWIAPDLNDMFVFSVALINLLAISSIFDFRASPLQAFVHFIWTLVKYNCCLLAGWMVLLAVANRQPLISIGYAFLSIMRRIVLNWPGRTLLADWQRVLTPAGSGRLIIVILYTVFNAIVFAIRRRFWPQTLEEPEPWAEWFRLNRPTVVFNPGRPSFYRSTSPPLSAAMRTLIRQLNIGEHQLRTSTIPFDFLFDLPCRRFQIDSTTTNIRRRQCFRCTVIRVLALKSTRTCGRCDVTINNTSTKSSMLLACSVCLDAYRLGDQLCQLPCGHLFHRNCIFVWLLTDAYRTCPCCRHPAYAEPFATKLFP